MSGTVSSEFSLEAFEDDFGLLLTDAGYGVLVENVELDRFDRLDGVQDYVLSIVDAVRDSVRDGNIEARVDSAYGRRIPREIVLRLIVLLRSHGVQLKLVHMFNAQDMLYWGSKLLK